MTDAEQWGVWRDHDGSARPCGGREIVDIQFRSAPDHRKGVRLEGPIEAGLLAWYWDGEDDDIIRYRIRKPRGLTILENLIAHIPQREDA